MRLFRTPGEWADFGGRYRSVMLLGVGLDGDKTVGNRQSKIQKVHTVVRIVCCPGELAKAQVRFEFIKCSIGNSWSPYDEAIINEDRKSVV